MIIDIEVIYGVDESIHKDCGDVILHEKFKDLDEHPTILKYRPDTKDCNPCLLKFDNSEYFAWCHNVSDEKWQTKDPVFLVKYGSDGV